MFSRIQTYTILKQIPNFSKEKLKLAIDALTEIAKVHKLSVWEQELLDKLVSELSYRP